MSIVSYIEMHTVFFHVNALETGPDRFEHCGRMCTVCRFSKEKCAGEQISSLNLIRFISVDLFFRVF